MIIKLKIDSNVMTQTPFNKEFNSRAQQMGGKFKREFDGMRNVWVFSKSLEQNVRDLLWDIYGTDGTPVETVTLIIQMEKAWPHTPENDELVIGGIQVLKKWDRDRVPVLGNGCAVIAGELEAYGGSRNNPAIRFSSDCVIRVEGVARTIAEQLINDYPDAYSIEANDSNGLTPAEESLIKALRQLTDSRRQMVIRAAGLHTMNGME